MPLLDISKIEFGELDARNEVFQQERSNRQVFLRSFAIPPSVDYDKVHSGAQFFISGLKGSGKTALIWYLKSKLDLEGATSEVVLFKSDLTEVERQKIATLADTIVFSGQKQMLVEYDYKQNWLWYIIRSVAGMIKKEDVIEGLDILEDLKKLTGGDALIKQSVFSGLQFSKIKTTISAMLKTGPFNSSFKSEIEAARVSTKSDLFEVINTCEQLLGRIKIRNGKRYVLLFDELELFVSKDDQKERDVHLIRDLLYAVARINRGGNQNINVYASVRTEVLEEVNRVGPEIKRDVEDFGARIAWVARTADADHPLLAIVSSKINNTEIEYGLEQTADVWSTYFTKAPRNKDIRKFLLDVSMLKPRNIIRILKLSQVFARGDNAITDKDFSDIDVDFSNGVWTEMEEELLSGYNPEQVLAIKYLISGFTAKFTFVQFVERMQKVGSSNPAVRKSFKTESDAERLLKTLYRIGAIGNVFGRAGSLGYQNRDRWIFRNFPDPLMHETFTIHISLQKSVQAFRSS